MLRLRSLFFLLFVSLCLSGVAAPAAAQSVASVVENMRAAQKKQLETVDTYIVETNLYTSYNRKMSKGGAPSYQTETKMKGNMSGNIGNVGTPSTAYDMQLDGLKEHATYEGTETVNGVQCHVLRVKNASIVVPDAGQNAQGVTYYIDADRHLPTRMALVSQGQGPMSKTRTATVNMKKYRTTDGLTLPHRVEVQFDMDMSKQQRRQMKNMMEKMENMAEQQRKKMQSMMGGQMDMMKQILSGEPIVVEVQSVKVNVELPEGMF